MNSYSNEELVDVLIEYGAAVCNGHVTRLLYQRRYSNRRVPHHTTFANVNGRGRESGHMMILLNVTSVPSVENLVPRISVTVGRISDMLGIFLNVTSSRQRLCQACLTTSGCNFEHLLL
ncbi:hypothetical protein TNCV_97931 [Trichonephila clavipes]|nr:hypothetical protein TNCV_97931 [Trichonephila clavipes]